MAADLVGYSSLMQRAEEATYANFEQFKREPVEPSLSRNGGRLIKTTGDGALAVLWMLSEAQWRYKEAMINAGLP